MTKKYQNGPARRQAGQSLVLLLFFVLMATTFTIVAILMMIVNSGSITTLSSGIEVRQLADSGAENALLKLIRDPFYTGETYKIGNVDIAISVNGIGATKTINVKASLGDTIREVEVLGDYTDNVLRVSSWKEIY